MGKQVTFWGLVCCAGLFLVCGCNKPEVVINEETTEYNSDVSNDELAALQQEILKTAQGVAVMSATTGDEGFAFDLSGTTGDEGFAFDLSGTTGDEAVQNVEIQITEEDPAAEAAENAAAEAPEAPAAEAPEAPAAEAAEAPAAETPETPAAESTLAMKFFFC